jgi:uncharacterized membrane protein (DUF373 family)
MHYVATISRALDVTRTAWPALTTYQRFEQIVALILGVLVSVLVILALVHLTWSVTLVVLSSPTDPAWTEVFQTVLGMVMTVLIALEFNHSIISVLERHHGLVRLRSVVLIALLAVVRKFIIVDVTNAGPATVVGLAASTIALGAVYWLVREQDLRQEGVEPGATDGPSR